jgi:hypothetical protein
MPETMTLSAPEAVAPWSPQTVTAQPAPTAPASEQTAPAAPAALTEAAAGAGAVQFVSDRQSIGTSSGTAGHPTDGRAGWCSPAPSSR